MIDGVVPYPDYQTVQTRERHVRWLTRIPAHWSTVASKYLFSPRNELALLTDQQLSATQAYGVIPQKEFETRVGRKVVQIVQHLEKRRHVEPGDFVVSMRSFQGRLERAWATGAIRSSYVVLRASAPIDVDFFTYLFKCHDYVRALQQTSNFIRDGQDLNFHNFSMVDLPVVPLDEQRAIARFLGYADRRIRRYIRAKQKLIKLLEEQKRAIIHQAVTRGLDPNVPLKPSGIDWLGDIPEHWELLKLKRAVGFKEGPGIMAADFRDEGVPLLRISCLRDDVASLDGCNFLDPEKVSETWARHAVQPGDYLLSASGSLGAVSRTDQRTYGAIPYTGIIRLWPSDEGRVSMEFIRHFMGSRLFESQFATMKAGVGIEHFGPTHMRRMLLVLPPRDEQERIVDLANRISRSHRQASERIEIEIKLLREYRARLVSDVVTGWLDVRGLAEQIPDAPESNESRILDGDEQPANDEVEAA